MYKSIKLTRFTINYIRANKCAKKLPSSYELATISKAPKQLCLRGKLRLKLYVGG